ncbi:cysteine desulfurase family protein [Flavobacterium enshiense]|uniref:cysteine desulfurase family protein n=1 Tax=Flavobacterium enshiense TaxID=1341165 RepID=UPI00345CBD85
MKKVYLDNASTTQIRSEVVSEMIKILSEDFGNPSSTHGYGRSAKVLLETARKSIAKQINATAPEIIFTSCGTEANNWILRSAVKDLGVERIITSKIEHHAVLHTAEVLKQEFGIQVDFVTLKSNGEIDFTDLVELLSQNKRTLVSLMHVNNEIGTILNLEKAVRITHDYNALFHSDTVQSIGKTEINVQELGIDFLVSSAHKFHGPKGVGFAYVKKNAGIQPLFFGGEQEKGLRAGTEAVHQIVGMAKALELAYQHLKEESAYIASLKKYAIECLEIDFPQMKINGEETLYNILNVVLPLPEDKTSMLLFHLDMKGVAVSRGSACQSGSVKPSHVLAEILDSEEVKKPSLRVSFSHYNTKEDVDVLMDALRSI